MVACYPYLPGGKLRIRSSISVPKGKPLRSVARHLIDPELHAMEVEAMFTQKLACSSLLGSELRSPKKNRTHPKSELRQNPEC